MIQAILPKPSHPEYRLMVRWRADEDGNGIHCHLEHMTPGAEHGEPLQTSFHPTLNVLDAVESALSEFFEK